MVQKKVIFAGIQNAGKTSILHAIDRNFDALNEIAPTKGVEYSQFEILGTVIARWDLGGQEMYRERYLNDISRYFLDVGLLIYVIDLQEEEPAAQAESISYLGMILESFRKLNLDPVVAVFLHKNDPEAQKDPELLAKLEKHKKTYIDAIQTLRDDYKFLIWYYPTSIKDPVELVKTFSHALLQFIDHKTLVKEKLWESAGRFGATILYLVEKSGFILGTSDPEGVPDDLQHAVERILYDEIHGLGVPCEPKRFEVTDDEDILLTQFLVKDDPYYLVSVWSKGVGNDELLKHELDGTLDELLEDLRRLITIFYPKFE
ncbi:MAG: ADP-ribosylation factor-like protein [Promethearchaeota archaeon]